MKGKPRYIQLILYFAVITMLCPPIHAQQLFFSDYFQGHVYMSGFRWDKATYGTDSAYAIVEIPPHLVNKPIRKAYILGGVMDRGNTYTLESGLLSINNQVINVSLSDTVGNWMKMATSTDPFTVIAKEITSLNLDDTILVLKFTPPPPSLTASIKVSGLWGPHLYIEYDDIGENYIQTYLFINNRDMQKDNTEFIFTSLNPINNTIQTAFGMNLALSYHWANIKYLPPYPTYQPEANPYRLGVFINNDYLGTVTQDTGQISGLGPHVDGTYKYNQMDSLSYGDNPDKDVYIADTYSNIQTLVNDSSTNFSLRLASKSDQHLVWSFLLAYSPHCIYQGAAKIHLTDTLICYGDSIQLQASGGVSYVWQSSTAISDSTVANPWVHPVENTDYICIFTDSAGCKTSKLANIKVTPKIDYELEKTASSCQTPNGELWLKNVNASKPYQIFWDGGIFNTIGMYLNKIAAGMHLLQIKDNHGCILADTVWIASKNDYQADYTAAPLQGIVPLTVTFSDNENDSYWLIPPDVTDSSQVFQYTFADTGSYVVRLISGTPPCTDTAYITVLVYDSMQIEIPNVFTPNEDGQNDVFSIKQIGVKQLEFIIYNRWGNEVKKTTIQPEQKDVPVWNGEGVSAGVYFYKAVFTDWNNNRREYNGNIHLFK